MSLSLVDLEVLLRSGTDEEKRQAGTVGLLCHASGEFWVFGSRASICLPC